MDAEADLRKRALSAAYRWGPSVTSYFHFGRPKTKKKKRFCAPLSPPPGIMAVSLCQLGPPNYLQFFFWWALIHTVGPCEQYFKGAMSAVAETADS